MSARKLLGAEVVEGMTQRISAEVAQLKDAGIEPALAILRVGEAADQLSYERGATKRCESMGVKVVNAVLDQEASQEEVLEALEALNDDAAVHGILLLQPLPKHIDGNAIRNAIRFEKDVDGASDASLGGLFTGAAGAFAPCTAQACIEILDHYAIDISGKRAAVIGRSLVIGKPVSMLLLARNATVTMCHSRTDDLAGVVSDADIVIAAMGRAETIDASYLRAGQIVVDVGINWSEEKGKLVGDVAFDQAFDTVAAITPVPGGVGAVTNCVLVGNVVKAAKALA